MASSLFPFHVVVAVIIFFISIGSISGSRMLGSMAEAPGPGSISSPRPSSGFDFEGPGLPRASIWEHHSSASARDKYSVAGGDMILAGFVLALILVVLCYIRITRTSIRSDSKSFPSS